MKEWGARPGLGQGGGQGRPADVFEDGEGFTGICLTRA